MIRSALIIGLLILCGSCETIESGAGVGAGAVTAAGAAQSVGVAVSSMLGFGVGFVVYVGLHELLSSPETDSVPDANALAKLARVDPELARSLVQMTHNEATKTFGEKIQDFVYALGALGLLVVLLILGGPFLIRRATREIRDMMQSHGEQIEELKGQTQDATDRHA